MGTVFSFAVADTSASQALPAIRAAMTLLRRLDAAWSPFQPDSLVGRLRRDEQVSAEDDDPDAELGLDEVLDRCACAVWVTRGAFDPWSLPRGFDPSGVVKGWAVERAVAVLEAHGLHDVAVSGGGDVAVRGSSFPAAGGGGGWRIGVRDAADAGRLLARTVLRGGGAIATSGIYERGRHVLDPRTGRAGATPAARLAAVSVLGPNLAWADVVATALLAEGRADVEWLDLLPAYRVLAVDLDGSPSGSVLTVPA
jgi:thiamine biosynthesis lipoprotein